MRTETISGILLGLLFLLAATSISASARPRDEVMSRAFRCAGIGDRRVWLDCYYGAAQPARAALKLPLAPAAQAELSLSPVMGSTPPQDSATRDKILSNAVGCSDLVDDRRWLDCYYAAAQPMRANLGLDPGSPAVNPASFGGRPSDVTASGYSSTPKNVQEPPEQTFGLMGDLKHLNSISSRMTSYTFDQEGFFTVALSNGQVWRQVEGDTTYAHWKGNPGRNLVRISRGIFGSFNLQVRNGSGLFKVRRLQ